MAGTRKAPLDTAAPWFLVATVRKEEEEEEVEEEKDLSPTLAKWHETGAEERSWDRDLQEGSVCMWRVEVSEAPSLLLPANG